jgi:hypothetical protein
MRNVVLTPSDEKVLSAMLTAVDDKRLQALLIGMSFIDNSPSSIAVQQALYALIAFYMYGSGVAMKYKVNAITALTQSLHYGLIAKDGLQHIAAGLLLSLYEVWTVSISRTFFTTPDQMISRFTTFPSPLTNGNCMLAEQNRLANVYIPSIRLAKEMLESFSHGCSTMTPSPNSVSAIGCVQRVICRFLEKMTKFERQRCSQAISQR